MMQDVLEANEPIAQPGLIQRISTSISRVSNTLTDQLQTTNRYIACDTKRCQEAPQSGWKCSGVPTTEVK